MCANNIPIPLLHMPIKSYRLFGAQGFSSFHHVSTAVVINSSLRGMHTRKQNCTYQNLAQSDFKKPDMCLVYLFYPYK